MLFDHIKISDYEQSLKRLENDDLIEEFETIIGLFESGHVDQKKVGDLYDSVKAEILERMEENDL